MPVVLCFVRLRNEEREERASITITSIKRSVQQQSVFWGGGGDYFRCDRHLGHRPVCRGLRHRRALLVLKAKTKSARGWSRKPKSTLVGVDRQPPCTRCHLRKFTLNLPQSHTRPQTPQFPSLRFAAEGVCGLAETLRGPGHGRSPAPRHRSPQAGFSTNALETLR